MASDNWTEESCIKQLLDTSNLTRLNGIIYGLCKRSDKDVVANVLMQTLKEIENQEQKNELVSTIADVLTQCSIETVDLKDTGPRLAFIDLVKCLLDKRIVSATLMRERLDDETSEAVGILRGLKKFTRIRTKLYFTQPKYNLLHKENEGYARLLTLLANHNQGSVEALKSIIKVIGKYSLDPNRVIDIILYSFECYPTKVSYHIDILKDFLKEDSDALAKLLVLKLNFYLRYRDEVRPITPTSLYRVLAQVLNHGLVELDDIYQNLSPKDSQILEYHKNQLEIAKAIARKINMVSVGDEKPSSQEDVLTETDRHFLEYDNSKLRLCSNLLRIGNWRIAHQLAKRLPEYYCFSDPHVSHDVCDLVNYLIDPIYRKVSGLPDYISSRIKPYRKKENFPDQVNTIEELKKDAFPIIKAVGPFLSADQLIITKLIRILKHIITAKKEDNEPMATEGSELFFEVLVVLDEAILPAVSISDGNCCLSRELWSLMKHFKYPIRYKLYYNWREEPTNPILLKSRGDTLIRAKYCMKRLAKDTIKVSGRHIGKLCYSNPTFTLGYILTQIQSYDNLIGPVVDALKFLTPLAHDVLLYCIIEALVDPKKDKHTYDGAAIAQWLLSLATFCASVIRKYNVEFSGFLHFIANQLKAGKSLDLLMLTELIQKMTGIETTQGMTDDKIEALSGGVSLRIEGAYFNTVKNTRKPSARLKDALIESELAMPLCILMAQLRDCIFFNQQEQTHIKLIGKLYDQCQETFVQYGAFLACNLSIEDYINFLPPLEKLMTDYKLKPDSAFFLARPMIHERIKGRFEELKAKTFSLHENDTTAMSEALVVDFIDAVKGVIDPIVDSISPTFTSTYGNLSPKIFVLFWALSMFDLEVPQKSYEREIDRIIKKNIPQSDDEKDIKRKKEKERSDNLVKKLRDEQELQQDHCKFVLNYLEKEKDNLFLERAANNNELMHLFIQHCLFSRSILTASDAIYSARFIVYLHELKIENFSTLICYDRLLCDITYMMGACTENEVNHYGRFLSNILKTVMHWHSSKEIYDEECAKYPGFQISQTDEKDLGYENYRHLCHKWHYRLTKAFVISLESNNYVQIRNALIVLISIIDYYPVMFSFGQAIEKRLESVKTDEKDKRQDLYALATAYMGRLESKKSSFIVESEFHNNETRSSASKNNTDQNKSSKNNTDNNDYRQSKKESRDSTNSVDNQMNNGTNRRKESPLPHPMEPSSKSVRNETRVSSDHSKNNNSGVNSSSRSSSKSRSSPSRMSHEKISSREKNLASIARKRVSEISPTRHDHSKKRRDDNRRDGESRRTASSSRTR